MGDSYSSFGTMITVILIAAACIFVSLFAQIGMSSSYNLGMEYINIQNSYIDDISITQIDDNFIVAVPSNMPYDTYYIYDLNEIHSSNTYHTVIEISSGNVTYIPENNLNQLIITWVSPHEFDVTKYMVGAKFNLDNSKFVYKGNIKYTI